jgi:hypothetical protein
VWNGKSAESSINIEKAYVFSYDFFAKKKYNERGSHMLNKKADIIQRCLEALDVAANDAEGAKLRLTEFQSSISSVKSCPVVPLNL